MHKGLRIIFDFSMGGMLKVRAGSTDIRKGGQVEKVVYIYQHEKYSGYDFDISLMVLKKNLIYSSTIQPVPLQTTLNGVYEGMYQDN